jgi:hypothetical protein
VAAGIEERDVLLRVGGKAIGNQNDLRDVVQARQVGDEVELDLIHEGKPLKKSVRLAERPALGLADPAGEDELLEGLPEGQAQRVAEAIEQNLRALEGLKMPDLDVQQPMPEAMKQLQKRMELLFEGGMNFDGDNDGDVRVRGSSSIRMQDPEGSIEMQSRDGSKQMRVRDKAGEIQWEGPWDTEQDKAAAPDDIRERIDRMNFDVIGGGAGGGAFKLEIRPGGQGLQVWPQGNGEDEAE